MIRVWAIHFFNENEGLYGDATAIIQYGSDAKTIEHCILIDTAQAAATTVKKLKNAGVKTIDAVVISHAHGDHYGGLTKVFENFKVKALYLPDCTQLDKHQKSYGNAIRNQASKAKKYGATCTYLKAGKGFSIGKIKCDCIYQVPASAVSEHDDHHFVNNESIVTVFTLDNVWKYHTAGDLQNPGNNLLIGAVKDLRADIFKIQWHGDANATNDAIAKAVKPLVAFSNYHHKERSGRGTTRKRLEAVGTLVMRNAEDGDVYFDCNGDTMTVTCSKDKNFKKTFTKEDDSNMWLNGIDIASYQAGIDLIKVPGDFAIVKATQGTSYVNPYCNAQYASAKKAGKLVGLYHYAGGSGAVAEADYFLKNIENYIGEAVLVLDWERYQNSAYNKNMVAYCKAWLDRIYEKTGVRPLIYMSQSVTNAYDWSSVAKNYGLWVARYADNAATGYKNTSAYGKVGAWEYPAIFQYTSNGKLSGWSGRLDLNIAYMDKTAWGKYAAGDHEKIQEAPKNQTPTGSVLELAAGVMAGKYGTGEDRKKALGSKYDEVQALINHIAGASIATLAKETIAGKYGNDDLRKKVLGPKYDAVQASVNKLLSK